MTYLEPLHLALERLTDLIKAPLMHEDAVSADAGLAAVAKLTRHHTLHHKRELSVVKDDQRSVTSKLKREAVDALRGARHQPFAHRG